MKKLSLKNPSLLMRIIIALILGITIGLISKSTDIIFPVRILATFSSLFGNLLNFIIPFIIIGFIVPGIASLGQKSGKVLIITTFFSYTSTIIAGFVAFLAGKTILTKLIKAASLSDGADLSIEPYFTVEIPAMMGVMTALVFAFLLGIGISKIKNSQLMKVAEEFNDIIAMVVKNVLIPLVPIYIGAIFSKLTLSGEIFTTMKSFARVYVVLFALQFSYIAIQFTIAGLLKKENPLKLIKNMLPAYFTAVGTQSSAATIPVTLNCTKNNNVKEEVADFVIPLCATIHLAGDTITLVLTSMGVMLMNGQTPTFAMMMPFILMLGVTMVAAPGVPGGGVMSALGLLQSMLGFGQLESSIMIALHAAQDSFGTATNVTTDGAIAIMVEKVIHCDDEFIDNEIKESA
ncbi:dicarboxylate/amino acid:cation symporter [Clostridium paraputrificum]|uniref:dicarboxylate/amino acid:cation symporter n=1 Tax=Clostridium paraputrificum TaxID=29363 RepID=UPI003D34C3AF